MLQLLGNVVDVPFISTDDLVELLEDAESQWWFCNEEDWKEAPHHPKIEDWIR